MDANRAGYLEESQAPLIVLIRQVAMSLGR